MKKIFSLFAVLLSFSIQGLAQQYINLYQDDVVIRQLNTEEIDSMSVTETEPNMINFWYDGKIFLSYNAVDIDSIKVTSQGGAPFSYMGIVGFNDQLYKKEIGILSPSTKSEYTSFVSNLPKKDGTLLYYAVDNALDMLDEANIDSPLKSVHFITFTDGLDQGSLMVTDKYSSSADYLTAMSTRIANAEINNLPVNAYSLGLRGNDVNNITLFRQNLQQLASSPDNVFEVSSISGLRSKLQDIANQIISVSTRQTMSMKIPGIDSGTKVRFVFDGKDAASSQLYIEGTFDLSDRSLHDVTYHGIKATSGKTVQGTQDGIFVTYTFTGMRLEAGTSLLPTSSVKHYYKNPSSSSWQINSEFSPAGNTQRNVSHTGTAIMLVLDSSSSLGSDFSSMQSYANEFINLIASNAEPFDGVSAPTHFRAIYSDDGNSINLTWDASKYAQSYKIYRSSASDGTFTLVAENIIGTSWTDNSPLDGKNYYRLYAVGYGLTSTYASAYGRNYNQSMSYVDLGLPSGTLWATCNIGANSPEDYGDYFAWGETEGYKSGKTNFSWSTYKWCNGSSSSLTKYNNYSSSYGTVDGKTELDLEDDAAYVNWGLEWRMPSKAQFEELINSSYTTTEWTTLNGVKGRKITSKKNGNSIFLPAAGYRSGSSLYGTGSYGIYWSRTLYSDGPNNAWSLDFNSSSIYTSYFGYRYCGRSVRPVRLSE